MAQNLVHKILASHLVSGKLRAGEEIAIRIDQTLTQDATGTMAYLQFEAMGIPKVRTKVSVSYIDHNMLQTGFENADDHRFLQDSAARFGAYFSRPGNGICHQVHLERFSTPGETLLGSDSHTPTCGGAGMLAIGAGGLDVAVAMGGGPFHLKMPKVLGVRLEGQLQPWVSAKDIILELLRRLTVKGGIGKVVEYHGPGVAALSVPDRSTITNMGAELGATTSVFPSDERTKAYLTAQGRSADFHPLSADAGATYDELVVIDLDTLEPMVARPSSPDNVVPVSSVAGLPVAQVCVGSCTNSSYTDLKTVAEVLKGKTIAPGLSMTVTPGSKQVYEMIAQDGTLADYIAAGARILESACGPCIGMGQAPPTDGISVRTFNRNFSGRSGTPDDKVYLCSPAVAAAAALTGTLTDPRTLGIPPPKVTLPTRYLTHDNLLIPPPAGGDVEIHRGPNIKPVPVAPELPRRIEGAVLLKVGDNITTDHILPAGSKILPLRSNIPAISEYTFTRVDPDFPARARSAGGGFVIGGDNYGQGSSREHAAMAPMFLGVRAIITTGYARIHHDNLVNFGILPLRFSNAADLATIDQGDVLRIGDVVALLRADGGVVENLTKGTRCRVSLALSERQKEILLHGGLLNLTRSQQPRAGAAA